MIHLQVLNEICLAGETRLYVRQGEHTSWRVAVLTNVVGETMARVDWFSKTGWVEVVHTEWGAPWVGDKERLDLLLLAIDVVQPANKDRDIRLRQLHPMLGASVHAG
jgi:hypothetical protein